MANPRAPTCFVEFSNDYVGVSFLDENLREYLTYQFQELESNLLFLTMAVHRSFSDNQKNPSFSTTYMFETDGGVVIWKEKLISGEKSRYEKNFDPAKNYETYPNFGQYESIARRDR